MKVYICCSKKDYGGKIGLIPQKSAIGNIINTLKKHNIEYIISADEKYLSARDVVDDIRDCDALLFVSSKNSNNTEKCINEVSTAHAFNKEIIVLCIDNTIFDDRIMLFLSSLEKINYKEDAERAMNLLVSRLITSDASDNHSNKMSNKAVHWPINNRNTVKK